MSAPFAPIVISVQELAQIGYTPEQFQKVGLSTKQLLVASIVQNRGDNQLARILRAHNSNLTQFVVEQTTP